jgi:vitamin B12 transporter
MISVGDRLDVDYFSFPSQEVTLSGYTVVNLFISYDVLAEVKVTGRVENLFDEKYEEVYFYNSPGRSLYGGVQLSL